ncbi:MAG: hypothetical protein CM15mP87_04720 [Candidatus Neomarinimicrobiota bacterium]|nr:MAG: hypothetical protein CM15mP87_04720 [Candidatus Neomarinimicrobiota bacterium]
MENFKCLDFQIGLTYVDTYIKENDKKSIPYLTEEFSEVIKWSIIIVLRKIKI